MIKFKTGKKLLIMSTLLISMILVNGCSQQEVPLAEDIMTQIVVPNNRTPITVLVKYAFSINGFEKAVEDKFSDIDIIQVSNYTPDMGVSEYEARLEHDDLTDIVMTWPLEVGKEYWEERLMDLSSLPLTNKYANTMLQKSTLEGKLYYLPGPSQVRGIVYNKTLFEEEGWNYPTNFEEFIEVCHEIETDGYRSLQLGLGNSEVLDTAFVGYGFKDSFSSVENTQALEDYNQGVGSFGDNFLPALETFQRLIDEGILREEDLTIKYQDRERMIFNRETVMIEDSVLMARMGKNYNGTTDEYALMPFYNPGIPSDWARIYPVCYIGVNKNLEKEGNEKKLELVLKILEYISTDEGQKDLSSDTGAMFSSLNGTIPEDIVETKLLVPALVEGRYGIFPTLKNAQNALRNGLSEMIKGESSIDDVIKKVDQQNQNPLIEEMPLIYGKATEDFTMIETGNYVTDVMRENTGADFALFLDNGKDGKDSGKGIGARLYQGDINEDDIKRIMPDLKRGEKCELWVVEMTGADLIKTLEYSIPVGDVKNGWFYYFSGLKMKYTPTNKPGERIKEITDSMDNSIEDDKIYKIAVMDDSVPDKYIKSCENTGYLIPELVRNDISQKKVISPSDSERFQIIK